MWLSYAGFSVYHSVFKGVCFVIGVQIDRFRVGGSDDHNLVLQCKSPRIEDREFNLHLAPSLSLCLSFGASKDALHVPLVVVRPVYRPSGWQPTSPALEICLCTVECVCVCACRERTCVCVLERERERERERVGGEIVMVVLRGGARDGK